jgi:hypothetical protein
MILSSSLLTPKEFEPICGALTVRAPHSQWARRSGSGSGSMLGKISISAPGFDGCREYLQPPAVLGHHHNKGDQVSGAGVCSPQLPVPRSARATRSRAALVRALGRLCCEFFRCERLTVPELPIIDGEVVLVGLFDPHLELLGVGSLQEGRHLGCQIRIRLPRAAGLLGQNNLGIVRLPNDQLHLGPRC